MHFGIDKRAVWNIACAAVSRILATFDATISLCPKRHDVFCMKNPIVCQLFYLFPDDSGEKINNFLNLALRPVERLAICHAIHLSSIKFLVSRTEDREKETN